MYRYRAKVMRVVDGDTLDVDIDLGFKVWTKQRVRMYGIDTPETRTRDKEEKKAGLASKKWLSDEIEGIEVELESKEWGKFGRSLSVVYKGRRNMNKELVKLGLAKEYYGGKR